MRKSAVHAWEGLPNEPSEAVKPPRVFRLTPYPKKNLRYNWLINAIVNCLAAFLLSRFAFFGEIYPAGIALFLLNRTADIFQNIILLTGIYFGLSTVTGKEFALGITVILSLISTVKLLKKTSIKLWQIGVLWSILRIALTLIYEPSLFAIAKTIIEIALSILLLRIMKEGFSFWENPLKPVSKVGHAALLLIILLALGGLTAIKVYSIELLSVTSMLLLLIFAYLGGGGVGAAMGSAIGIVVGLATGSLVIIMAILSTMGLLGGFLKMLGKWGTAAGALLGFYLIMQQIPAEMFTVDPTVPWTIGLASFILIPKRFLSPVSNYFPNNAPPSITPQETDKAKELILSRLTDLAGIFGELATSFNQEELQESAAEKMDLYSLLDQVCTKNCQHCNGYENCWGENFYATYRELFDLLAMAELYGEVNLKHLKGRLAKNCFQQFKLLTTINHLFEKYQTDYHWQRKFDESKLFLANQLQGVSDIINNLAVEITNDIDFRSQLENQLKNCLHRIGINVKDIAVLANGEHGLEIKVKQRSCFRKKECHFISAPLISKLLGEDYTVCEKNCQCDSEGCSYSITPTRHYEVRTVVCKLPKDGNDASGDNHALHELKDGHFVAILSDGMGNGNKAALESKTTVTLLEKLLETGIDSDFAVKMVNSVLLLRSPEESFATVDMALINLYTARSEFIKIGAATTYIKRGRDVWSIKSTSLPAGILNTVDVERTVVDLQSGDLVVLVTDGVVDSKMNVVGKEDWMVRALRQVEVVGPEALGEYLLNLAKINQDGVPKDDMTVIVLQLLKRMESL